ncbi:hypothetical protein [Streptomyces salinarius]|uniref:Uncharacterized protein n=1 Tax=Streptomyces salinarius TaxID=2762598 RepID=A0ABW8BL23_9ACTN
MAHHPLWTLTYTSLDTGKVESGNQQRVNALVQMDLAVGRIAGKFKGAVFRQARVELQLSRHGNHRKHPAHT